MDLDPELVRQVAQRAKRALRARMRALRGALPPGARAARSRLICERLLGLPEFQAARSIALYSPLPDEVAIEPVDAEARVRRCLVHYPFMDPTPTGFRTGFRGVDALEQLVERGRSFREPPAHLPAAERGDIDLVIVPALAVSAQGYRLGYGSGFYDATLPDVSPPARVVVVAFDFQLVTELPVEQHDVVAHVIVTDKRIERPGKVET